MKITFTLLLIVICWNLSIQDAVYKALKGDSVESVDYALNALQKESMDEPVIRAYKGALLMKKAGLINGPLNKLDMFKEGHKILEKEIQSDPKNTEYRFLRLTIQENAPKILGYNENLDEDKLFIGQHYHSMSLEMKLHIKEYASRSTILNQSDLID